jgi:pilus assembly protein CpaE
VARQLDDPSALGALLAQPNPSLVLLGGDATLRRHIDALEAEGSLASVAHVADPEGLLEAVDAGRPDIVFAELGADPDAVLDLLDKLPVPRPRLLLSGSPEHGRAILRAMRMGVAEFFEEAPDAERLRGVVQRIAAELVPENEAEKSARIVAVMGAKGGVGATVVACQIAARLQAGGARVAVVDLCLPLGDVALYFDVPCSYTIADIAQQKRQVDRTYLETLMDGKPGGVRILASPTRAEEAELVNGSHVEQVIGVLRRQFDWVILDVSRIFGEPTVRALDLADEILLVTLMDVSTLHHSHHLLELLERLGHTDERVRLVANRHAPDGPVEDKDVKEFLGRELDFRIPNDFPTAAATITQGASAADVAPRSALARAFAELHRNLHAWSDREPPAEKSRGAFARFFGRS